MPRGDVMQHLLNENIALCIGRQSSVIGSDNYDIVFVSEYINDFNLFRRGGELVFPLYIYRKAVPKRKLPFSQLLMFEPEEEYEAILSNISMIVRDELVKNYKIPFLNPTDGDKKIKGFGSKDIFYYIYAVLYSNIYRTKYAEFLKRDFPRVPFTKDYKLFIQLGKLGKQLADLHLLKSKVLDNPANGGTKFPVNGNNKIEKLRFDSAQRNYGKVWINKEQYFNGIKEEVWQYQIGGYQVCEKWLKDRKERTLTSDEIKTYCKIVTALSQTIELQNEIDKYFGNVEKTV
jgi:predicted helicase